MLQNKSKTAETNLLVSIKDFSEISDELINLVNIIDLKDPSRGSIGSWKLSEIRKVIKLYKSKIIISATLGDIFDNKRFLNKLEKFDELNLDFIKFGLLSHNCNSLYDKIKLISLKKYKTDLVCVIFADKDEKLKKTKNKISHIKDYGINHILLDTFVKINGDIFDFCDIEDIEDFINLCKEYKIKIGIAGGLKEYQIPSIINLSPDIIGFRSAVCENRSRTGMIQKKKLKKISSYFRVFNNKAIDNAGA